MNKHKPVEPVKPSGIEVVFLYSCPFCSRELPMVAPTKPSIIRCDLCHKQFPIVPVEERSIVFIKTMLGEGTAAVDSDYM